MTYEKEIPAYALQVAKAPQIVPCQAVYHTEKMMSPGDRQTVTYQLEEDILVPDTRDDMEEILLMEAWCDMMPSDRKLSPKTDELLNLTGTITIQTLYRPEKADSLPVSITSKVPYQYQWHLHYMVPAEGFFSCKVKSLEHMIINERKFRVKITLEFISQVFLQQELLLFQGLEQEQLEMKKKAISLGCLEAVKKEELEIDDWIEVSDSKTVPVVILQQQYTIMENYRQVTSEKIVLNGFLFVDLLYQGEEDGEMKLCHHRGRIEFTQFLPLEKKYRGKKWSFVKTNYRNQGLKTVIDKNENGISAFHIEGKLETCIALFESREAEVVEDAYHQTKQFTCNFAKHVRKDEVCHKSTEISFRELIQLPDGSKAEEVICGRCRPVSWECTPEKGRIRFSVSLEAVCLWKGEAGFHTNKTSHLLQQTVEVEGMEKSVEAVLDFLTKECRVTLFSERQLELAGSLIMTCEGKLEKELRLLESPGYVQGDFPKGPAIVITAVEKNESLWTLAKRHHTTEEQIRRVNHLEGELTPGQKIFIIR